MWTFLSRLGLGGSRTPEPAIDSVFQALDDGAAARPLPTLVCRTCGLKYANTGTYLKGSRCPQCHPDG
jgi:predicted Zn-ribbon and HTH transcriptional regulator